MGIKGAASNEPPVQAPGLAMIRVILLVSAALALVTSHAEVEAKAEKCSHQFRPPFIGGCICLPEGGPCPKSKAGENDEIAKKTGELEALVKNLFPSSDARTQKCTHQFQPPFVGGCICLPEGGPCPKSTEEDRDDGCKRIFNIRRSRCVCWPSGKTVPCP